MSKLFYSRKSAGYPDFLQFFCIFPHYCWQSASVHIFCPQLSAVSTKLILARSLMGSSSNLIPSIFILTGLEVQLFPLIALEVLGRLHGAGLGAVRIHCSYLSTFLQTVCMCPHCVCMCLHCVHTLNKYFYYER